MPVGKLQLKLDIPSSALSRHLKKLIEARLVSRERRAQADEARSIG